MDQFVNSKLVDVLNKLVSGSRLVQFQAISKLHALIVTDVARNDTEKKKLLNKLVEIFGSIESKHCCVSLIEMLVKCATAGILNYEQLINSFLVIINSRAKNSIHCLEAITRLILEFSEDFLTKYSSIRNPSHPFIELLRNSDEDFGQLVLNQIRYILDLQNRSDSLLLVKPVLIHLFLDEPSVLKHQVASYLIQNISELSVSADLALQLIRIYFSCLKRKELKSVYVLESIDLITRTYETSGEDSLVVTKMPPRHVLSLLIDIDAHQCCDCSHQFKALRDYLALKSDSFKKKVIDTDFMRILASNLGKIGLNNLVSYLELAHFAVANYHGESKLDLGVFIPSLVTWNLCFASVVDSIDSFVRYADSCKQLLSKIEERLERDHTLKYDETTSVPLDPFEYEDNSDPRDPLNYANLNELGANFILNDFDLINLKKISNVMRKLVKKHPNLFSPFFCLYILKLRLSRNHETINYLMNSLVDLVVPKTDVTLCVNVLKSLMSQENALIKLVCVRLMTKLCTSAKLDYLVYPMVSKELMTVPSKANPHRLEELYTKAYCIFEIVSYRPDYYAQELLATISSFMNSCANESSEQGVSTLLIDSLTFLCESQVLDVKSTWTALTPQYRVETRALPLTAYARFMSVVCKIDDLNDSQNEFYSRMVQSLWSLLLDRKDQPDVVSSAFKELSSFQKDAFKCSFLPVNIQNKLKQKNRKLIDAEENKEKSLDEIFPLIPASCYIDLFNSIENTESYPGVKCFFQSMLSDEIDSMPRRTKSLAREKVFSEDEQLAASRSFYEHLRTYLVDESQRELALLNNSDPNFNLLIVLFGYDAPGDRNLEGKLAKRHVKSYWEGYERTYESILSNGLSSSVELTEENIDLYKNGFQRFIQSAYAACLQSFELETKQTKPDVKQTNCLRARDKLTEILVRSSKTAQNDFYLLILHAIIQTSSDYVVKFSVSDEEVVFNQRKWVEVIVDFILNIRESRLQTNESEYVSQFNYNQSHSTDTLRFLFKLYDSKRKLADWSLLDFFMSSVLEACVRLRVSSFLVQFIDKIVAAHIESLSQSSSPPIRFAFKTISVYLRAQIRLDSKFDMAKNTSINVTLASIVDSFRKSNDQLSGKYLGLFAECMFALYDDDSVYYDDRNLLTTLVDHLEQAVLTRGEKSETSVSALVYLSSVAYKSSLVGNELVRRVYSLLINDSKFNRLVGFYSRYLLNYGFYDALTWIQTAHQRWHKFYTDFKLNLETDLNELESSVEGILSLISGISIETINLDQSSNLAFELDSLLKPESTIKDVLKFIKTSQSNMPNLKRSLSYLFYKRDESKCEQHVYATQNTFDYLDNQSLLKGLTNEALCLAKETNVESSMRSEHQFTFWIETLADGVRASSVKTLPPVNWLNLVNTLIKSRFGARVERQLIELALLQIDSSNSAFVLVKNYLIDTSYLTRLQPDSQRIVLDNLTCLFEKLNDSLLKKFLGRLRVFLGQKWACQSERESLAVDLISSTVDSIDRFFASRNPNDDEQIKSRELVDFFLFIIREFPFDVSKPNQSQVLRKIVKTMIKIGDDRVKREMIDMSELIPVDVQFLIKFYFRAELTSSHGHPMSLLNDPIEAFLKQIELVNESTKSTFLNIFAKCILEMCYSDFKQQATATIKPTQKSNNVKNQLLNWFIEFMSLTRTVSTSEKYTPESSRFSLTIYTTFMHYTSACDSMDIYDPDEFKNGLPVDIDRFDQIQMRFLRHSFWKQIDTKMFDLLIALITARNTPADLLDALKKTAVNVFTLEKVNDQMWLKFANFVHNDILSTRI